MIKRRLIFLIKRHITFRTIVTLVYNVLKAFMEMDSQLFDKLTATFKAEKQKYDLSKVVYFHKQNSLRARSTAMHFVRSKLISIWCVCVLFRLLCYVNRVVCLIENYENKKKEKNCGRN